MHHVARRWLALFLFAASGFVAPGAMADESSPVEETKKEKEVEVDPTVEAAALVLQLGANQFSVREAAADKLVKIGLPALKALQEGKKNNDREIRFRCERILATVEEVDFERRVEAFAAGKMTADEAGLPCWDRFKKVLGEDAATRALFIDVLRQEGDLLRSVVSRSRSEGELLAGRVQQVQMNMRFQQSVSPGTIAALLLLASDDKINLDDGTGQMIYSYCNMNGANQSFDGPNKELMRKLLAAAIKRGGGQQTMYQALMLSMRLNLKEGLAPAEDLAKGAGGQPWIRQMAIFALGKLGDEKQIPVLEGLLGDTNVCAQQQFNQNGKNVMYTTQVRDCALAVLIHLTKQQHKEYGMERITPNPQMLFNMGTMGYENDEKRTAAIKKWNDWKNEQKKKGTEPGKSEPPKPEEKRAEEKKPEPTKSAAEQAAEAVKAAGEAAKGAADAAKAAGEAAKAVEKAKVEAKPEEKK